MKKVVLLGDSIRLYGYGKKVADLLKGEYEVWQPDENCRFAKYTLRMVFDYQDHLKGADIIHWNNGLWDACDLFNEGTFASIDEYRSDMLRIAKQLLKYTPNVIFSTTTPILEGNEYISNTTVEKQNSVLVPELIRLGIRINDLFTLLYAGRDGYIREDDKIHLTDKGIDACAEKVASAVREADKDR